MDALEATIEAHRAEILRHCYRMLGSGPDAEDALQDALLKAWQARDTLRDTSAARAWLYRIATHVCLDRARAVPRVLPHLAYPPAEAGTPPRPFLEEATWVGPFPTSDAHERAEQVTLAFVAALQHLPARQRATLLLREVVELSARETADVLGSTPAAVEAALQRARITIGAIEESSITPDEATRPILERYMSAWHARDASAFVSLLAEEAELVMPPTPVWFRGRHAVGVFVAARFGESEFRLMPLRANERPGFALYRKHEGAWVGHGIQVLEATAHEILRIHTFLTMGDASVFASFGLAPKVSS